MLSVDNVKGMRSVISLSVLLQLVLSQKACLKESLLMGDWYGEWGDGGSGVITGGAIDVRSMLRYHHQMALLFYGGKNGFAQPGFSKRLLEN